MDNHEAYWHYHSEVQRKPALPPGGVFPLGIGLKLLDFDPQTHFQIKFKTRTLRPNHRVTLRTNVTGWGRDLFGTYWDEAWFFSLPKSDFPTGCEFKFRLDDGIWNEGFNLSIAQPADIELNEQQVRFPEPIPQRFTHGYQNLRVSEDEQQQSLLGTDRTEEMAWDVIVIGSGMGGGVLADALADLRGPDLPGQRALKVLVLDAGSFDYPSHIDNLPVTALGRIVGGHTVRHYETVGGETRLGQSVHMNLGGRSVFWSGLIPQMGDWELVNWPQAVQNDLTGGGYAAAEKLMRKHVAAGRYEEDLIAVLAQRYPGFKVVDTPRSAHQPEFGPEGNPEQHPESFIYRSTGTFSSAELLLDSLRNWNGPDRGQLFINCNHLVTRLEHDGRHVTGVVCQDLVGNRERSFRGKIVVLAAGSMESAKIALQSNLTDPDQKIGVGFTDHPSYYAPDWGEFALKPTSPYAGAYRHARIFFYPEQQWQGHWFNVEIVVNGRYWWVRHADDEVLETAHPPNAGSTVKFKFIFSSPLQENNWVRLGGPDGRLLAYMPENPSGGDARQAVRHLLEELLEFFQAEPVNLNEDKNFHFGNGGTPAHAGGTLRMPTSNPHSPRVVDENLKFTAYDNLYACDPSVYPYIPAANPSLTLVALAQRLAKHLGTKF